MFHVAVFGDGNVCVGCVGRSSTSTVLFVGAQRLEVEWDASWAEFATARFGVLLAKRLGYGKVVLESDAINVISSIQQNKSFLNPVFHFVEDIHMLVPSFSSF